MANPDKRRCCSLNSVSYSSHNSYEVGRNATFSCLVESKQTWKKWIYFEPDIEHWLCLCFVRRKNKSRATKKKKTNDSESGETNKKRAMQSCPDSDKLFLRAASLSRRVARNTAKHFSLAIRHHRWARSRGKNGGMSAHTSGGGHTKGGKCFTSSPSSLHHPLIPIFSSLSWYFIFSFQLFLAVKTPSLQFKDFFPSRASVWLLS